MCIRDSVNIHLNEVLFAENGAIAPRYKDYEGEQEMNKDEICLTVSLGRGSAISTMWTSDLSYEYIKINTEYRT